MVEDIESQNFGQSIVDTGRLSTTASRIGDSDLEGVARARALKILTRKGVRSNETLNRVLGLGSQKK